MTSERAPPGGQSARQSPGSVPRTGSADGDWAPHSDSVRDGDWALRSDSVPDGTVIAGWSSGVRFSHGSERSVEPTEPGSVLGEESRSACYPVKVQPGSPARSGRAEPCAPTVSSAAGSNG